MDPAGIVCRPRGIGRSRFADPAGGMPIQTAGAPDEAGRIEIFDEFATGSKDMIEGHRGLRVLDRAFATRAPARPNRIGLSIVLLQSVAGNVLHFTGNDVRAGSPVLDVKPDVPAFDVRRTDRIGRFADRLQRLPTTRSDDRMA